MTYLTCACVLFLSTFVASPSSAGSIREEPRALTATICSTPSVGPSCPEVVALARTSATERQISMVLDKIWETDSSSGPPILGYYGIQRCSNPGLFPFQLTCVLWSSASRREAKLLGEAITRTGLFQVVDVTTFGWHPANVALQIETDACRLISAPPNPAAGASQAISIPASTLSALRRTGNPSLQGAARDYVAAAREGDTEAMIGALSKGVAECHRLGLRTADRVIPDLGTSRLLIDVRNSSSALSTKVFLLPRNTVPGADGREAPSRTHGRTL